MAGSGDFENASLAMSKVSIQIAGEQEVKVKGKKADRHCAFCLTLVPGEEVKICSKCKRRAYCSKECQTADWKLSKEKPSFNGKIHGYGQGHKNWCGFPYGEEDLDWKVAPISGKNGGLGLIALRDIPPVYKIVVEGMQAEPVLRNDGNFSPHHPGMDELPFRRIIEYWGLLGRNYIGLRSGRVNHQCDPNACHHIEEEFDVLVLYSNRAIKEGEEICMSYSPFNNFVLQREEYEEKHAEFFRNFLVDVWGITCTPSCICRDEKNLKMLETAKELYQECRKDGKRKNVLPKMDKVIEIAGKLKCPASCMCVIYYCAAQCAQKSLEMNKAKEYLEMTLKLFRGIHHPENEFGKTVENEIKDL